jgi:hypothetical protein
MLYVAVAVAVGVVVWVVADHRAGPVARPAHGTALIVLAALMWPLLVTGVLQMLLWSGTAGYLRRRRANGGGQRYPTSGVGVEESLERQVTESATVREGAVFHRGSAPGAQPDHR